MTLNDLNDKHIHFIGVGGIGMSGIAQLLAQRGYRISGSDLSLNENTQRLQKAGVHIVLGHDPAALEGKDIVVASTDIKENNAELKEARRRGLLILHRSEMLALLVEEYQGITISGTHGKTTTTALMGWVLEKAGLDPTIINGGVMNGWESNVKVGQGKWCVVEADESDGSFLKLPRKIAIVTNINLEHMDYYGDSNRLYDAFETFTTQLDSGGVAVLGIDHPQVYILWQRIKSKQRCLTYGLHPEAEVRAENIQITPKGAIFDLVTQKHHTKIFLPLYGQHNVLNALGVAATALDCGLEVEVLKEAFETFEGVQRRFTRVGDWQGVTFIDDYAHHPVEIRATLAAAKSATKGRVIAVLEPHRYSRLTSHFQDFATCCEEANITIVLPVYAAREVSQEDVNHADLVKVMKGEVYCCDKSEELPQLIQNLAQAGDMVICLGAGSISSLARALPIQLNKPIHEQVLTGK
ncbi:MAG TPA: UDP-N-acetylmuramate--L-alanine ligase [Alphaproteobacteria bacterium]|nr:UDP-N-acetylmuramate--L-alanine ligase [Alphaproteobacteria bacterium]